jgi:hypothetical protein
LQKLRHRHRLVQLRTKAINHLPAIAISAGADNLYAMIPNQAFDRQVSSITINGSPVTFTVETIKGRSYAVFPATTGNVVATYNFP